MITKKQARRLVEAEVCNDEIVIVDEATIERPWGWVFSYASKTWLETKDPRYAIAGNAPIIVERQSGKLIDTGTAMPIEHYIANYERCGEPYGLDAPEEWNGEFSKDELCDGLLNGAGSWNALSPFAEDLDALVRSGGMPGGRPVSLLPARIAAILASPDLCITHRFAGASVPQAAFFACVSHAEGQTFVVVAPERNDRYAAHAFGSAEAYLGWWLFRLSSASDRAIPSDLPPTLPLPALIYALHAVDGYRRAKYQSALSYGATDSLRIGQPEFIATMREAITRRDLRWLLPAFIQLAPGVATLLKEPPIEQLTVLQDAKFLLAQHDQDAGQDFFCFGDAAQRMGNEFIDGIGVAVGFRFEVLTELGALPLIEAFLAPTRLSNHLIELEPDGSGLGIAMHRTLTQRELYIALAEMIAAALLPAAPKVALKRAILTTASTQEQRDEVLGISNEQRVVAPDAQQTSSQIVCSHCGQVNPATMKFCGQCGNRLLVEPSVSSLSPQQGASPVEQSGKSWAIDNADPARVVRSAARESSPAPASPAPAVMPQGPTVTVRRWFRMLSVAPHVHFRFQHDPADARRLLVVEHPGKLPREVPIDGGQVQLLAQELRQIRDGKFISDEEFKALHAALRVRGADGALWTVGLASLRWNRLEQGRWVPAEAPEMVWLDMDLLQEAVRRMPPNAAGRVKHVGTGTPHAATPQAQSCRACGKPLGTGTKFCTACGAKVIPADSTAVPGGGLVFFQGREQPCCAACGKPLRGGANFCTACGAKVGPAASSAAEGEAMVELPARALRRVLAMVQYAMGHGDNAINGLLMAVDSSELRVVATDGHRLALAEHPVNAQEALGRKVILARNTVVELTEWLAQRDAPVAIDISPSRVRFRVDGQSLAAEIVDREFPDYRSIIPSARAHVMRIDRQSLARALQRVSRDESCGVQWELNERSLVIRRTDASDQVAQEELSIRYHGVPLRIAFNARYLLDALNSLDCDEVEVTLDGAMSSVLLTIPGRQDFKYVVMPMRID